MQIEKEKKTEKNSRQYQKPEFEVIKLDENDELFYADSGEAAQGGCLSAGTKITMADGSVKRIEDVVVGDVVRTFDHEEGASSTAQVCLANKGDGKDRALQLQFRSGKSVSIVGTHCLLLEKTRKYVRLNSANVDGYLDKRFYNAELRDWDTLTGYTISVQEVDFYNIYTKGHLNCVAEGVLTAPDDTDFMLNIYELDANLKADAVQLKADIDKYGLLDVGREYPELIQFKEQLEALQAKYQYIAVGKGLVTKEELAKAYDYWKSQLSETSSTLSA